MNNFLRTYVEVRVVLLNEGHPPKKTLILLYNVGNLDKVEIIF